MGREKGVWLDTEAQQLEKIKQLEAELAASRDLVTKLQADNSDLTANLGQTEVVRQNTVKSLVPTVFRRLMDSEEYKKSLAKPLSLSYSAGWLDGVRLARKPEEVEKILRTSKKVNLEAPSIWKEEFNKVFSLEYPFIRRVANSYRLPLGDLMNIFPASSTPQGLLGGPDLRTGGPTSTTLVETVTPAVEENVTPPV